MLFFCRVRIFSLFKKRKKKKSHGFTRSAQKKKKKNQDNLRRKKFPTQKLKKNTKILNCLKI